MKVVKVGKFGAIDRVDVINDTIWEAYDILRKDVESDRLDFILYLIVLHSENLFPNVDLDEDLERSLSLPELDTSTILDSDKRKKVEALYEVHEVFKMDIIRFRPETFSKIYSIFNSIEVDLLHENLSPIFEEQLARLTKAVGKRAGGWLPPTSIARFSTLLADLPRGARVYNPFAGGASFGLFLTSFQVYLGQELNERVHAIGTLRLIANDKAGLSILFQESSLKNWGLREFYEKAELNILFGKFELIISMPPFNARLPKEIQGRHGVIRNYEHFLIEKGIEELSDDGKLIAVISNGFLSKPGVEQNLRKYLVEKDLVETVISLPGGLLMNTGIPVSILKLNKFKTEKGVVRFVNAGRFVNTSSSKEKTIDVDALMGFILENRESESSRQVSANEIAENDYNLYVNRYLVQVVDDPNVKVIKLGEVVKARTRESAVPPGTKGRFIRIRDLKTDIVNFMLSPTDIEIAPIPSSATELKNATLLIALRFKNLRPSLINGSKEPIFVTSDIMPLQIDESLIEPDYLLGELSSDFVRHQVDAYSQGASIQSISRKDILSLKIRVPSREEQKAKVRGLREEYLRSKHRELELTREILGLKDESFREFASIRHTLNQYLNALRSNVSGTIKFISNNEGKEINLETKYSENLNQNLGDHLLSLEHSIDSMSRLLNSTEQSTKSELPTLEMEMDLGQLVLNAQNRFKKSEVFLFEPLFIDKESFSFDGESFAAPLTNILADDFYGIFSNIVANACDHGFKGRTNNVIRTSLAFDWGGKLILEISNNGHPLPENFTLLHLTTRGEKTSDSKGMGIGGADIKVILDKYDATLDIRKEPGQEFSVTYILTFNLAMTLI